MGIRTVTGNSAGMCPLIKHVTKRNMASTQLPLRPLGGASLEKPEYEKL